MSPSSPHPSILLAFDSFKNSLSAESIHTTLSNTIHRLSPETHITSITLSDGGQGFLSSLTEGQLIHLHDARILGPDGIILSRPIPYRKCCDTIYIEMACSSGIELVERPNCMICSSYGTGQVIREVLLRHWDVTRIVMGVGGTATSEAGIGALLGLGRGVVVEDVELMQGDEWECINLDEEVTWMRHQDGDDDKRFHVEELDGNIIVEEDEIFFTGQDLALLKNVKFSKWAMERMQSGKFHLSSEENYNEDCFNQLKTKFLSSRSSLTKEELINLLQLRLERTQIDIASDVKTRFCGTNGAVSVYSKQKGASSTHLRQALERGMLVLQRKLLEIIRHDICDTEGTGAAGGISGMFHATLGACIESGIELMARQRHLEDAIQQADLIFTGEGRYDSQTAEGKTVSHVCKVAQKHGKSVVILCGQNTVKEQDRSPDLAVYALVDRFPLSECMSNTAACLDQLVSEKWKAIMQRIVER